MRQPLEPLPGPPGLPLARRHRDADPARAVGDDQPREHRPDRRSGGIDLTVERQGREGAQLQRHRQVVDHRVHPHEATHAHHGDGLEVVDRSGVGGRERGRERLPSGADADREVVGVSVGVVPLPHPGGTDHRRQFHRIRVPPQGCRALRGGGLTHLFPGLPQVPQVVLAQLVRFGGLVPTAEGAGEHAQRRDRHHHREQHEHGVAHHPGAHHHHHHAHHRHHQDDGQHDLHQWPRGRTRQGGRRLERDLSLRNRRRCELLGAREHHVPHDRPPRLLFPGLRLLPGGLRWSTAAATPAVTSLSHRLPRRWPRDDAPMTGSGRQQCPP